MIGIVVVSHSAPLAAAAVDLALQMGGASPPPLAVAAGTADGGLGTDAAAIADAIDRVASDEGVLVVMDLGSALLSAEMAGELRSSAVRVVLSPAPFVEGLVAAVVTAAGGADLDAVAEEAGRALSGKRDQLGVADDAGAAASVTAPSIAPATADTASAAHASADRGDALSFEAEVHNPSGLHARPAAMFVRAIGRHDAEVEVTDLAAGRTVPGHSLISLMALGVHPGTRVRVSARGPGARAVLDELRELIESGFGEV